MLILATVAALACSCELEPKLPGPSPQYIGTDALILVDFPSSSTPPATQALQLEDDPNTLFPMAAEGTAFTSGIGSRQLYRPEQPLPPDTRFELAGTSRFDSSVLITDDGPRYGEPVTALPVVSQGRQPRAYDPGDTADSCGGSFIVTWDVAVNLRQHWQEYQVLDEEDEVVHQWIDNDSAWCGYSYCESARTGCDVGDRPRVRARLVSYGGEVGPWSEPVGTTLFGPEGDGQNAPASDGGCQSAPRRGLQPWLGLLSSLILLGLRRPAQPSARPST